MDARTALWEVDPLAAISHPSSALLGLVDAKLPVPHDGGVRGWGGEVKSTCFPPLGPADPFSPADDPTNKGTLGSANAVPPDPQLRMLAVRRVGGAGAREPGGRRPLHTRRSDPDAANPQLPGARSQAPLLARSLAPACASALPLPTPPPGRPPAPPGDQRGEKTEEKESEKGYLFPAGAQSRVDRRHERKKTKK